MDQRSGLGLVFVAGWLTLFFLMNRVTGFRGPRDLKIDSDDKIPFVAYSGYIYFSTYLLFLMPYFFVTETQEFRAVLLAYTAIILTSTAIFIAYPTRVVRQENLTGNTVAHRSLRLFQRICKPYNSFPSMHTAYVIAASLAVGRFYSLWLGVVFGLWAVAVMVSTLAGKQHVLLDLAAGAMLGLAVSCVFFW